MTKLLEIKNLVVSFKTFGGEVKAVRGVSFDVNKGEVLAVVGESGCGKSVTSQSIMRLLPQPPTMYKGGQILFEGSDILQKTEKEMQAIRGKDIGMIFQDPMTSLNPTMKVGKQITEVIMRHQNLNYSDSHKKAVEMLKLVGVANPERRFNQYPHEFSGGMRQRAMIAIALACQPKLLIADEPTTALDVTIQAQILEMIKDLRKKINTSIILITHNLGIVSEMCDRVVVMYAGVIIETGNVEDILKKSCHPYTKGLLKSVPHIEMDRSISLNPIIGSPPDLFSPPEGCPFFPRCQFAMNICKKNNPKMEEVSPNHYAACWLNHPSVTELSTESMEEKV